MVLNAIKGKLGATEKQIHVMRSFVFGLTCATKSLVAVCQCERAPNLAAIAAMSPEVDCPFTKGTKTRRPPYDSTV